MNAFNYVFDKFTNNTCVCVCECVLQLWVQRPSGRSTSAPPPPITAARCSSQTQEPLKSRAQIMSTIFTAGSRSRHSQRDITPQPHAWNENSHTHTHEAGSKDALFRKHSHAQCLNVPARQIKRDLTVKARWIAVDSQQETTNCWLFLFRGLFIGALQWRWSGGVNQHVWKVEELERKVIDSQLIAAADIVLKDTLKCVPGAMKWKGDGVRCPFSTAVSFFLSVKQLYLHIFLK